MRSLLIAAALASGVGLCGCAVTPEEYFTQGVQAYEEGAYDRALSLWQTIAEDGHGPAQRNLGVMYFQGQGVEQDYEEALRWFQRATDQGTELSALKLAAMHAAGQGTPQDLVTSYKWLRVAENQGDPQAASWHDDLVRRMSAEQIAEAEELAAAWHPVD